MAPNKQNQNWVNVQYGFMPKTCWIADEKNKVGLPLSWAPNRKGDQQVSPCPPEKEETIRAALRNFGMINR